MGRQSVNHTSFFNLRVGATGLGGGGTVGDWKHTYSLKARHAFPTGFTSCM